MEEVQRTNLRLADMKVGVQLVLAETFTMIVMTMEIETKVLEAWVEEAEVILPEATATIVGAAALKMTDEAHLRFIFIV